MLSMGIFLFGRFLGWLLDPNLVGFTFPRAIASFPELALAMALKPLFSNLFVHLPHLMDNHSSFVCIA